MSSDVNADWTTIGKVNGVQVYRDNDTGLEWTVPLSRVSSFGAAKQKVANLSFHLPTHREFRSLEKNGGIGRLGFNTAWAGGFYWEASGGLVNGNGNNFSSLFPLTRARICKPHAAGVRRENRNKPQTQTGVNSPKIHVLFVWGTNDKNVYWATKVSREKILNMFNEPALTDLCLYDYYRLPEDKAGLIPKSKHIGSFVELQGDNAHPKRILEECRKISQKASINDAVLVYMLCHDTYVLENGEKVHGLSPVCVGNNNPNIQNIGIKRSSIMREIKSKPHRLNVLITDSCPTLITTDVTEYVIVCRIGRDSDTRISKLEKLLLHAQGTININSSDPNKGIRYGELTLGWMPTIKDNENEKEYLELASNRLLHSGTAFTNAFINLALTEIPKNEEYSAERFVKELKKELKEEFRETIQWLEHERNNIPEIMQFELQGTQTLTQFDDQGVVLP
ncbi:MAG: hypothetical protein LBG58_10940 [Planctomycetaceae bacterium]|nr:hypothetical protein [Planctomycetaceae bacterium]